MREFKFRCWHNGNRRFGIKPVMLYDQDYGDCLVFKKQGQDITAVMQFTGLHDKNGKEIYEGDIVAQYRGEEWELIHEVRWNKPRCSFWLYIHDEPHLELTEERELEVIGNIFEHPDLAKKVHKGGMSNVLPTPNY